ncbi:hypothetical protein AY600_13395 [Phormidium willei BDU 130791]|nr:hypothetical protein AY600_13395 [Phormidium willei BDU 130791]
MLGVTSLRQIRLVPDSAMVMAAPTWAAYKHLLLDLGDNRPSRIAYARGELEVRMPGVLHELLSRVLAAIVATLADELGLEFNDFGSVRLENPTSQSAVEPDGCFYLQNAQQGQGFAVDISAIAPDLVIEVDIASRSQRRLPIYAALGVPEIWLYRQERLEILRQVGGGYEAQVSSIAFPVVTVGQLNQWLGLRQTGTDLTVIRAVRQFCREVGD